MILCNFEHVTKGKWGTLFFTSVSCGHIIKDRLDISSSLVRLIMIRVCYATVVMSYRHIIKGRLDGHYIHQNPWGCGVLLFLDKSTISVVSHADQTQEVDCF